jgi:hypothetical protein
VVASVYTKNSLVDQNTPHRNKAKRAVPGSQHLPWLIFFFLKKSIFRGGVLSTAPYRGVDDGLPLEVNGLEDLLLNGAFRTTCPTVLGHLQRADSFWTPNRFDLVCMGRPADSQSGIVRMGRGVHPAARRKVFFDFFFIT